MTWTGRRVGVVVVLGAAALLGMMVATRGGSTRAAAPAGASARTSASSQPAAEMPVTDLRLELLDQSRIDLGEPERNLFRFGSRPVVAATPRPVAQAAAATPAATSPRPSLPPSPSGPPPIQLRYIGLFDAPGQAGRVAILSDGRGNVFNGKEGDIIEGRYRVGRVTPDSLELSYVDGRGRQVIRLSGQ